MTACGNGISQGSILNGPFVRWKRLCQHKKEGGKTSETETRVQAVTEADSGSK